MSIDTCAYILHSIFIIGYVTGEGKAEYKPATEYSGFCVQSLEPPLLLNTLFQIIYLLPLFVSRGISNLQYLIRSLLAESLR